MSTNKQVEYAAALLAQAGYSTTYMNKHHKHVGATMRERTGLVRDWLARMDGERISGLIDLLKRRVEEAKAEVEERADGGTTLGSLLGRWAPLPGGGFGARIKVRDGSAPADHLGEVATVVSRSGRAEWVTLTEIVYAGGEYVLFACERVFASGKARGE